MLILCAINYINFFITIHRFDLDVKDTLVFSASSVSYFRSILNSR